MQNMENKIQLETRNAGGVHQIKKLNFNNYHIRRIIGLTSEFRNLVDLSMSGVGLTTLEGFPPLKNLLKLNLSSNGLKNGLEHIIHSRNLRNLNLTHNAFNNDTVEPLRQLKNLQLLEIYLNELKHDYTSKLFSMIPSLKYVDAYDRCDDPMPANAEEELTFRFVPDDDEDKSVDSDGGKETLVEESTETESNTLPDFQLSLEDKENPEGGDKKESESSKPSDKEVEMHSDEETKSSKPEGIVPPNEKEKKTSETEEVPPEATEVDPSVSESKPTETQEN